jgi:hypothetical protein
MSAPRCTRGLPACGRPAVVAYGVVRSCGCPNAPVAYNCEDHERIEPECGVCRHCRHPSSCARTEPVRIRSAA